MVQLLSLLFCFVFILPIKLAKSVFFCGWWLVAVVGWLVVVVVGWSFTKHLQNGNVWTCKHEIIETFFSIRFSYRYDSYFNWYIKLGNGYIQWLIDWLSSYNGTPDNIVNPFDYLINFFSWEKLLFFFIKI